MLGNSAVSEASFSETPVSRGETLIATADMNALATISSAISNTVFSSTSLISQMPQVSVGVGILVGSSTQSANVTQTSTSLLFKGGRSGSYVFLWGILLI